ncbi:MAG: helix-turn-helix transcriptional regulator [Bacteroidales bacterium]|nr:helix-turn-helix transcriptional regulator [Bacteroidales bacterium]
MATNIIQYSVFPSIILQFSVFIFMNDLTKRFIDVYNSLLVANKVANASDFAQKIGVSSSLITEILKERTNVGITPLQNAVIYFNLDANYLLSGKAGEHEKALECSRCADKDTIISLLKEKIAYLEKGSASNNNYSQTA